MTDAKLAAHIEHTLFAADASAQDVEKLCDEARQHGFFGVCVNGSRVELACARLEDSGVQVVALVGFPLGAGDTDAKRYEAEIAADQGAHEIDFVINAGWLNDGDHRRVLREMRDIVEAAEERPVKAILELAQLSEEEKIMACELALDSGVRFLGAGTGFHGPVASVEEVRWLGERLAGQIAIKVAGEIRVAPTARALIEAGATRIGTGGTKLAERD
jgi:deoxyribose-phosphate aldolase